MTPLVRAVFWKHRRRYGTCGRIAEELADLGEVVRSPRRVGKTHENPGFCGRLASTQIVRAPDDRQPAPSGVQSEPDLGQARVSWRSVNQLWGWRHHVCAVAAAASFATWRARSGSLLAGHCVFRLGVGGNHDRRVDVGRVADGDPMIGSRRPSWFITPIAAVNTTPAARYSCAVPGTEPRCFRKRYMSRAANCYDNRLHGTIVSARSRR